MTDENIIYLSGNEKLIFVDDLIDPKEGKQSFRYRNDVFRPEKEALKLMLMALNYPDVGFPVMSFADAGRNPGLNVRLSEHIQALINARPRDFQTSLILLRIEHFDREKATRMGATAQTEHILINDLAGNFRRRRSTFRYDELF